MYSESDCPILGVMASCLLIPLNYCVGLSFFLSSFDVFELGFEVLVHFFPFFFCPFDDPVVPFPDFFKGRISKLSPRPCSKLNGIAPKVLMTRETMGKYVCAVVAGTGVSSGIEMRSV